MDAPPAPPQHMRAFFIVWFGQLVSLIGSGITGFALGVWVFERTGQVTPFALTILLSQLPRILLAPLAGTLVDRWNRRRVMIVADTGNALATLLAALFFFTGTLELWQIYLVVLIGSACAAFQEPAYTASITMLVPKKDFARAAGLVQMSQAVELLAAPLLAGVLFVTVGLGGIILIDMLTFLVAVGTLLLVRIPQPEPTATQAETRGQLWAEMRYGWQYLRVRTGLLGLLLYFALVNLLLNFATVLTGPLVLSFGNAQTLGLVQTALGFGMLAGSIAVSAWGGPQRRILLIIGTISVGALGVVIAGLHASALVVGFGLFLLTFCVPFGSAASQSIFQAKVAPGVQGRVFAIRTMISRSMMPLAFLSAGVLADAVFEPLMSEGGALAGTIIGAVIGVGPGRGLALMCIIAGLVLLLVSAVVLNIRQIRFLERELPDAVEERDAAPDTDAAPAQPTLGSAT